MTAIKAFAKPLARSRLHEEIVTIIQKQIIRGTLKPGEKLPTERDLAESLQVNRATVREALRKLETLELLEIRHGDGVYARNYLESGNLELIKTVAYMDDPTESLLNVLEVRRILVPEMAALAAQRRSADDLAELSRVIFTDELTILERDLQVHHLIARATHNLFYTIILNFFNQLYRDFGYLYFNNPANVERSQRFHQEILDAITAQAPDEARRIMTDVLRYAEEAVADHLKHQQ